MTTTIVSAQPGDLPLVQSVAHRTWPIAYGKILTQAQLDYMLNLMYTLPALEKQVAEGIEFLLLQEGGETVGFVGFQYDYLPETTKVHKLYVLPQMQGKGYGKALLLHVKDRAVAQGQARLRLDVNRNNKALYFYQKLGFAEVDQVDTDIGNGFFMNDYVMERKI
ncbi:MAG: GNAT family N-acetyltransferase [Bacteroidota bacterium]